MEHQDWTQVILKKTITPDKKSKVIVSSSSKPIVPANDALDFDEKKVGFFTAAMGKKISSLRNEKGWTQEQLAQKMNLPKKTITDLEQGGKEKYNGVLVSKLKKVLGNFCW